jgi:hypothetical protein
VKVNKPSVSVNTNTKSNTETKILTQPIINPTTTINTNDKSHVEASKSSFVVRVFMWIKNLFK